MAPTVDAAFAVGTRFPSFFEFGLPRAGIGFDRGRIAAIVDAAIEEPAHLIDQPGHELGAVPRPVPVLVVLRHADIDVFLADARLGQFQHFLTVGHGILPHSEHLRQYATYTGILMRLQRIGVSADIAETCPLSFRCAIEAPTPQRKYVWDRSGFLGIALDGVRIGVGRDAAEVAFTTVFGKTTTGTPKVWIEEGRWRQRARAHHRRHQHRGAVNPRRAARA